MEPNQYPGTPQTCDGAAFDLVTKAELATLLKCSRRQIERLQLRRRIPVVKLTNRMVRYSRTRVLAALAKVEVEAIS